MRDYYIFKSGRIKRKDNSIMFEYLEDGRKNRVPIPVNDIDSIYLFGEVDLNTKLLNFFSQNNIMINFLVVPTKQCRFENTALFYFVNT